MHAYQPDRVVKTLTAVVSFFYYLSFVAVVLVLITVPVTELFPAVGTVFDMDWPVTLPRPQGALVSDWNPSANSFELDDVEGRLSFPANLAPVWYRVAAWAGSALLVGLFVLFLHHLRRLFQRVRDGAPFDAQNGTRLRWLGILLIAIHSFQTVFEFVMSVAATRALENRSTIDLGTGLGLDLKVVFIGLVLIALAEIFRRGAALEDEQSLVV
jgi:hypothetical protein